MAKRTAVPLTRSRTLNLLNTNIHRAKATQNFLRDNTPDFISSQEWTPHSPDLNPLDCSVWDILQELVYLSCLQCFDAVGWVAGRASGL